MRVLIRILVLAALCTVSVACRRDKTAPDAPPAHPPRRAILLMLDAARPDRFSCYGYERETTPSMDALARGGLRFKNHFAQGTSTRVSVSTLMWSRYFCIPLFPGSSSVPFSRPADLFRTPDDAQTSFVRLLRRAGLHTAAISAHLWTGEGTSFANEFDEMHDLASRMTDRDGPYPRAERVIDHAIDWIEKRPSEEFFLYIHLMDPHYPHYFEEDAKAYYGKDRYDGRAIGPGGRLEVPTASLSDDDRRYAEALYDGSLRYTDRHVGRLVEALDSNGLLSDTLIVITADHGEHLFDLPGGRSRHEEAIFVHGGPWYDAVARIPLILHYPASLAPKEVNEFSEGVDLGPTLLSLLGVSVPEEILFDGVDQMAVARGDIDPKPAVYARGAIRTRDHKLWFDSPIEQVLAESPPSPDELAGALFDLRFDPAETRNLFGDHPELVGDLLAKYRARMAEPFLRYEYARTSKQPTSAFAIGAQHMQTTPPIERAEDTIPPQGWSLFAIDGVACLAANRTSESIDVRFRVPNGEYELIANLKGAATVEIDGKRHSLDTRGVHRLGKIHIAGEAMQATITPVLGQPLAFYFFGFEPDAAPPRDPEREKERLQQLKSLGYVGD